MSSPSARKVAVEKKTQLQDDTFTMLLLTQNIGAIEANEADVTADTKARVQSWIGELVKFFDSVSSRLENPVDVFVVHLQELGGKKFNGPFNRYFAEVLSTAYPAAGWCSGLLMPAEECDQTFTAMGTVMFVSHRLIPITSILSVRHRIYVALEDNPHEVVGSQEYFFHGAKFSNAEKSRKGFLLTSLRIGPKIINFVNLHLFHDADNSVAVKESPSTYVFRRREALTEAMVEISPLVSERDPLYIFGDFNFRLDGQKLITHIQNKFSCAVTMGKKAMEAPPEVLEYFNQCESHLDELLSFDQEGAEAMAVAASTTGIELGEFKRGFRPTYAYSVPVSHNPEKGGASLQRKRPYNFARLPAWCDRVLFNPAAFAMMTVQSPDEIKARVAKGARGEGLELPNPSRPFDYASYSLGEMDHESVFLLLKGAV
jgi:hypothetical protein